MLAECIAAGWVTVHCSPPARDKAASSLNPNHVIKTTPLLPEKPFTCTLISGLLIKIKESLELAMNIVIAIWS